MSASKAPVPTPRGQQGKSVQDVDAGQRRHKRNNIRAYLRAGRFMGSYYLMLMFCIGVLVYFLLKGVDLSEDLANTDHSMDVASGVMLGLFAVLATFTVVFFALRAEEAATNSSNSVVQEIIDNTFNDEEQAIATALLDVDQNSSKSDLSGSKPDTTSAKASSKRNSIYYGVDRNRSQLFIWSLTLSVTAFLGYLAYNSFSLSAQTSITLAIGVLSILVTFTVVLFALRAARFSQITGRIAAHSAIERLATSHEQIYHQLLDSFLDLLIQERLLIGPRRHRYELIDVPDKTLNRLEQESFNLRRNCEEYLLYIFSFSLAIGATLSIKYLFFTEKFEPIALSINLIVILFIFLITLTTVFFSGRVVLSAIGSSEIQATEMTRSELEHQKAQLRRRIDSVEKIRLALKSYLGAAPEKVEDVREREKHRGMHGLVEDYIVKLLTVTTQKTDDQIVEIAEIQMHLRHLQSVGAGKNRDAGKNKQFNWICDYLKELWTTKCERMIQLLPAMKEDVRSTRGSEGFLIEKFSKARKEDDILMKLWRRQMEQQKLMPGLGEESDEKVLKMIWKISLLDLDVDKNVETLMARLEKIENDPPDIEGQYEKEATDASLSLKELNTYREYASDVFDEVLVIIQWELAIIRFSKVVSDLPNFEMTGEIDSSYNADWSFVELLQKFNPVFLDTRGPKPIVSDYHLERLKEIKKAPELVDVLRGNDYQDSKQST